MDPTPPTALPKPVPNPPNPPNSADTLARLRAGQLKGCTRLDLRGQGLRGLPPEVLLLADTLEALDLSGNQLHTLPEAFAGLHRLRVLFCSDNLFTTLPAVLGRCRALDIIGFKANQIEQVPAASLAPSLRWLILTDNRIAELPHTLGACTRLQKLMLAGNQLRGLPDSLAACGRLELLRIAANQFDSVQAALPASLLALPRLAWLAYAGNPFSLAAERAAELAHAKPPIPWQRLHLQGVLGEGASGVIHAALWQADAGLARPVAVKLFKGAITSDGLPRSEMAACLAAGEHPQLVGVQGQLIGHPDQTLGIVLNRIPTGFDNLAAPPSLATCTRDVYAAGQRLDTARAVGIAQAMTTALAHLHGRGLVHGDLYAHNIQVDAAGRALLGDFGAASFLPTDDLPRGDQPPDAGRLGDALRRFDRRALACLIDELALRCDEPAALHALRPTV